MDPSEDAAVASAPGDQPSDAGAEPQSAAETALDSTPPLLKLNMTSRQQRKLWRHVETIENFWETLSENEPGVVARLAKIAIDRRWEVIFLTKRPQTAGATAQVQSQRWLESKGFPLPSVFVVQGSRGRIAAALDLAIVVDDRPENCLDVVVDSKARAILVWRENENLLPGAAKTPRHWRDQDDRRVPRHSGRGGRSARRESRRHGSRQAVAWIEGTRQRVIRVRPNMETTSRIFVAGHGGLVGSALMRRLRAGGFSNLLTATRDQLDLRDQAAVNYWFRATRPEYVFLAAGTVGGILANSTRPAEFIYDNMLIHATVVHSAHLYDARRSCCTWGARASIRALARNRSRRSIS